MIERESLGPCVNICIEILSESEVQLYKRSESGSLGIFLKKHFFVETVNNNNHCSLKT